MLELPPLPSGIRTLTDDELHRLRGRYPKLPKSPDDCITCGGRGTFRWWNDGKVADWKCNCIDQFILHLALLNANIGLTYQRTFWADAIHTEAGALGKALDYTDNAEAYMRAGLGLILYGSKGTGKTLLTTLLLRKLIGLGYDAYFTTFSEMIDTYTGGWNDGEERRWFHRRIKNTDVLGLDDVGKEYQGRKASGLPESTFDEVLRHRVAASTPTLITTNLDMDKLQQGYGGGVMSLLHERSTTYCFTADDWRDEARMRLADEVRQGLVRPVTLG